MKTLVKLFWLSLGLSLILSPLAWLFFAFWFLDGAWGKWWCIPTSAALGFTFLALCVVAALIVKFTLEYMDAQNKARRAGIAPAFPNFRRN